MKLKISFSSLTQKENSRILFQAFEKSCDEDMSNTVDYIMKEWADIAWYISGHCSLVQHAASLCLQFRQLAFYYRQHFNIHKATLQLRDCLDCELFGAINIADERLKAFDIWWWSGWVKLLSFLRPPKLAGCWYATVSIGSEKIGENGQLMIGWAWQVWGN